MTRPIPKQIVATVAVLAESLATWCEEGRDGRLEQHEAAVVEQVREALPARPGSGTSPTSTSTSTG